MLFAKQLEEVISAAEGLQERARPRRGEPSMSIRLWRDRADSQAPTEPLDEIIDVPMDVRRRSSAPSLPSALHRARAADSRHDHSTASQLCQLSGRTRSR
jgi:hypothetical protein